MAILRNHTVTAAFGDNLARHVASTRRSAVKEHIVPQEPLASRKTGRAFNTFAASRAFGKARKMANGMTLKKKSSI
jgi:hypothetical protein